MSIIAKKLAAKKLVAQSPTANGPVESVQANITTYTPDGAGKVNLGPVVKTVNGTPADDYGNVNVSGGGGGSVSAISINGDTKQPDSQGLVALGNGYLQSDSAYGYVSVDWANIESYIDNLKFDVSGPLTINITGTPEDGRFYVFDFADKVCGSIILGPTAFTAPIEALEVLGFLAEMLTLRNIYVKSFHADNCNMIDTSNMKFAQPTSNRPFLMLEDTKMILGVNDATFPTSLGALTNYLFDLDYFASLSVEGTIPYTTTTNQKYVELATNSKFACTTWASFNTTNIRSLDNTSTCVVGNVQLAPTVPQSGGGGTVNSVNSKTPDGNGNVVLGNSSVAKIVIDDEEKSPGTDGICNLGTGYVKYVQIADELFQTDGDQVNLTGGVSRKIKVNGEDPYNPDIYSSITDLGVLTRKITVNGTTFSPATTTGITDIGNVATSVAITPEKTYDWSEINGTQICGGDVLSEKATQYINIVGTPIRSSTYTFDLSVSGCGGIYMRCQGTANAPVKRHEYSFCSVPYVYFQKIYAEQILLDSRLNTVFRCANITIPAATGTNAYVFRANGPIIIGTTVLQWETPYPDGLIFDCAYGGTFTMNATIPFPAGTAKRISFGTQSWGKVVIAGDWPGFTIDNITNPNLGTVVINGKQICPTF